MKREKLSHNVIPDEVEFWEVWGGALKRQKRKALYNAKTYNPQ